MIWNARCALMAAVFCLMTVPCSFGQNPDDPSTVIAWVGSNRLTAGDLQKQEGGKLLQAKYQYYLNERKALEELIDNQLLADEARRRNISVDQLLSTEVFKDVKDPTEDQLEVYYEGLDTQEPYEAVRNDVLNHIRELRHSKARAAFIASLRQQAHINVMLMSPSADLNLGNVYEKGDPNAPVVLVEFADYECPYCQKVNPQIQQLKKEFGDKLTIAFKDFPLPMHHSAEKAAEAARCAGQQGKYWEYHDVLFYSKQLEIDDLKEHARVLKLDGDQFDACLDSGREAEVVQKDLEEGKQLGLTGTPSFFINGHFFSGVIDVGTLRDLVNQQLNDKALRQAASQLSRK